MKDVLLIKGYTQKCGGGRCPKILIGENGDALIQGLKVDDVELRKSLNIPSNEDVVLLPADVLQEFVASVALHK